MIDAKGKRGTKGFVFLVLLLQTSEVFETWEVFPSAPSFAPLVPSFPFAVHSRLSVRQPLSAPAESHHYSESHLTTHTFIDIMGFSR